MTDFAGFRYGGVTFPLDAVTDNSLLRDADPALFYALEFYASVITTHIQDRLLAEAELVGATQIQAAVATSLPLNPEPYLTESHITFPLLSLYRKSSASRFVNLRRSTLHTMELAYVLPPLKASEAESLLPILHAVGLVVDQRTIQGFDPAYTPTKPLGTAGEFVWSLARAGVRKATITASSVGAYAPAADLFFPALLMTLELDEMSEALPADFEQFDGADITGADGGLDLKVPREPAIENFITIETHQAPTLASVTPNTGDQAGGTAVTLTGTGFRTGTRPLVLFDGASADAVTVVSDTSITCVTPPHAAYPSLAADVVLIGTDGQAVELQEAFTFTA